MYCTKCGKEIESGSICSNCAAHPPVNPHPQTNPNPYVNPQPPQYQHNFNQYNYPGNTSAPQQQRYTNQPEPYNRMFGFGKALTSTIMSHIGFFIAYMALIYAATIELADIGIVFFMISLPLVIIPLILGISSINTFKRRKATCAKPVATLVLGIVGLSTAAFSALFDLFALLVFMTI